MTDQMRSLFDDITKWQVTTFGEDRHPSGPAAHLLKEAGELFTAPDDIMELADVLFLAFDVARCNGYSFDNIIDAMYAKLFINKERKWNKPDKDGVCEHIPDASCIGNPEQLTLTLIERR